ncbi:hypothetical protein ACFX19_001767 [Malus domestica]
MAVGLAIAGEAGQYNSRMTLFVIISCMMAAIGGVIFGYDIGISGGVTSMEPFLKKFFPEVNIKMKSDTKISNYCKFDSELWTSFTSSLYISGLVASLFASLVTRAYGRKPSILAGGAAFLASSALNGAAMNIYMLILGHLLLGVGIGFGNQAVPLYLSEMAPPKYRGAINNGFQFSFGIGVLSANLINYGSEKIKGGWVWRISLAMAAVPASMLTPGALFLPGTPNSLIQHNADHQTAKQMLQRIRGVDDVQAELVDLIKANHISKNIKHPFKKILERKYRPQLVMAIAIPFFQQVTGINVISALEPRKQLEQYIGTEAAASPAAAMMVKAIRVHELGGPEVEPGQMVLVHAAGGVGFHLCQWTNAIGATVIGTVSTQEKPAQAKEDGCHHVIIYEEEDFVARVKEITFNNGVDVVYDGVGKVTFEGSLAALKTRGHMVSLGSHHVSQIRFPYK